MCVITRHFYKSFTIVNILQPLGTRWRKLHFVITAFVWKRVRACVSPKNHYARVFLFRSGGHSGVTGKCSQACRRPSLPADTKKCPFLVFIPTSDYLFLFIRFRFPFLSSPVHLHIAVQMESQHLLLTTWCCPRLLPPVCVYSRN